MDVANLDEENNSVAPTIQAGQSATFTAGSQQPGAAAPTSSGRFTNVQRYLNANKNADIGGKLAGNIGNEADKLKTETANEVAAFTSATPTADSGFLSNVRAGNLDYTDPNIQAKIKAHQNSSSLPGLSNSLTTGSNYLNSTVANAQDPNGHFSLLRQYFNKPSYNKGQQNLDYLLMNTDATQAKKIQDAAAAAKTQVDSTNAAISGANTTLTDLNTYGSNLNEALGGQLTKLSDVQSERQHKMDMFLSAVERGDVKLANQYGGALGIDPASYMSANAGAINQNARTNSGSLFTMDTSLGASLTPAQLAQYNALANLTGATSLAGNYDRNVSVGNIAPDAPTTFVAPTSDSRVGGGGVNTQHQAQGTNTGEAVLSHNPDTGVSIYTPVYEVNGQKYTREPGTGKFIPITSTPVRVDTYGSPTVTGTM